MDPELRAVIWRYTIVGIAIAGAAVWTVLFTVDNKHVNGAPTVMGTDAGSEVAADNSPGEKAPSLKEMFIVKDGQERVSCAAACRLEHYCALRDVDECTKASCTGTVRVPTMSDGNFAKSGDCTEAATAPCSEACNRCGKGDPLLCTANCTATTRSSPAEGYRRARCMLEKSCGECDSF